MWLNTFPVPLTSIPRVGVEMSSLVSYWMTPPSPTLRYLGLKALK